MTSLEDRLRDAYRAVTDTVREDELPGLHDKRARNRRRGRFGAFAPLAAAATVVVAIVASVAVPKLANSPGRLANPVSSRAARTTGTGVSTPTEASAPGRSAAMATSSASRTAPGALCPALTAGVDGSVAPLFCAHGTDNPAALAYYQGGWVKGFTPKVLALPSTASYGQVVGAVCADIFGHGSPMGLQTEQQAYDLAANRAGWRYHINTVNGLSCPVVGTSWARGVQGYGQVEPQTISNNGDPASLITHITWSSWGGARAYGTGLATWVPPGQPAVNGVQEPATVVVFSLGTCAGQQSYNAIDWYFPQHGQQFSSQRYFDSCTGQRIGTGWP
ncbi:MAG TPA: hypothetical protein VEF71_11795 [Streptosporangiaceae bacterium]|nr:hypothetical protein [Streptosporangiaceae bacterium]